MSSSNSEIKSVSLEELTKNDVARIAAMIFNWQLLGPSLILEFAERWPWLVNFAPDPEEMNAVLNLARRGKTVNEADESFTRDCFPERNICNIVDGQFPKCGNLCEPGELFCKDHRGGLSKSVNEKLQAAGFPAGDVASYLGLLEDSDE